MKRMKALALGLAAVMLAGLTACGGSSAASDAPDGDGDPSTLTVAMECAYAPYNWTQTDDSNGAVQIRDSSDYAYGYDVMMAKKIAEALGQEVQIVKLDWDSLVPAVMSGDVDCVIAGQSITSERAQQVDFTDPYYYASIVTLVKKDSPYASAASVADLAGATCTSQLGTIWYDICLPQIENANLPPPCWWLWTAARATSSSPTVPPRRLRWWPTPTSSCWTSAAARATLPSATRRSTSASP